MRVFDAAQTAAALPWRLLIEALREAFNQGCDAPARHQHQIPIPGETPANLLLMPAWRAGGYLGVKQVMVVPDNHKRGLAAISANYLLYDATSGQVLAMLDGNVLTHRRTAAASALAADYLAPADADHLLMIGTGGLAPNLIAAHAEVRQLKQVRIWGRDLTKAQAMADGFEAASFACEAVENLNIACQQADIISCATLSTEPLVLGRNIKSGCHMDLVGAFTPEMCEADIGALECAQIFVDTRQGALSEAGDIMQAIKAGAIQASDIEADLAELCQGQHTGRRSNDEITLFKSVGTALEDLAAAALVMRT